VTDLALLDSLPGIETKIEPVDAVLERARDRSLDLLLTSSERGLLAGLKFDKRRREWLAGRLLAKELISSFARKTTGVRPGYARIEILPRSDGSPAVSFIPSGETSPRFFESPLSLSISHRLELVAAAVVSAPAVVGIDVEKVERRSEALVRAYLTRRELAKMAGDSLLESAAWSAKESVFKAVPPSRGPDPREVEVHKLVCSSAGWSSIVLSCEGFGDELQAWCRAVPGYVVTVAVYRGQVVVNQES